MNKFWASFGLLLGVAALALQFSLSVPAYLETGLPLWRALVHYFSYFTIQTNIILVLVYMAELFSPPWLSLLAKPSARVMAAALITLVMLFYHFVLAAAWAPQGAWKVADILLHYVTPLVFLTWFVFLRSSDEVKIFAIPKMLIYPVAYVIYVLVRGALSGAYPYDIFDAGALGYPQVLIHCALLMAGVIILMLVAIAFDRISLRKLQVS